MPPSRPEQLTIDGRSVPHEQVVKEHDVAARSSLAKEWEKFERERASRSDQKEKT